MTVHPSLAFPDRERETQHACWVVDGAGSYRDMATDVLDKGVSAGRKCVVFGAESHSAVLGGGPLEPDRMVGMFREQSALARDDGFTGLCVVADMNWILPINSRAGAVIRFEVQLERLVTAVDATVVCAYRADSFDAATITGALCVHPNGFGTFEPPPFQLVAVDGSRWRLSGEVDILAASQFRSALDAVTPPGGQCEIDVSALQFIDVRGLRTIARTSTRRRATIRMTGASPHLQRVWDVGCFPRSAPQVHLES